MQTSGQNIWKNPDSIRPGVCALSASGRRASVWGGKRLEDVNCPLAPASLPDHPPHPAEGNCDAFQVSLALLHSTKEKVSPGAAGSLMPVHTSDLHSGGGQALYSGPREGTHSACACGGGKQMYFSYQVS